ncbi:hypothetical protein V8C37DRAFT_375900 [Trichoderma ceciliae]
MLGKALPLRVLRQALPWLGSLGHGHALPASFPRGFRPAAQVVGPGRQICINDIGLISFSEAARFSQDKYQESQAWCKRTDRPHPMHLLYPRTKGPPDGKSTFAGRHTSRLCNDLAIL